MKRYLIFGTTFALAAALGIIPATAGHGCGPYSTSFHLTTGPDDVSYGAGVQSVHAEAGDDKVSAGDDDDALCGDGGRDQLHGQSGRDTLIGGADGDFLWGEGNNDTIEGGDGMEHIYGGYGDDVMRGEHHDDEIYDGYGVDEIHGGAGTNDMWLRCKDGVEDIETGIEVKSPETSESWC